MLFKKQVVKCQVEKQFMVIPQCTFNVKRDGIFPRCLKSVMRPVVGYWQFETIIEHIELAVVKVAKRRRRVQAGI